MLAAHDGDRFADAQTGADTVGALTILGPDRTGNDARPREFAQILVVAAKQQHRPLRRRQRHQILAVHQTLEQPLDLGLGDAQKLFAFLHHQAHLGVRQHFGTRHAVGHQIVVGQTAFPRFCHQIGQAYLVTQSARFADAGDFARQRIACGVVGPCL